MNVGVQRYKTLTKYSYMAFVFLLPFGIKFSNLGLILIAITAAVGIVEKRKNIKIKVRFSQVIILFLFLSFLLSLIISGDIIDDFFLLEKRLILIAFPLLFVFQHSSITKYTLNIEKAFVLGCIVISVFNIVRAFYRSIHITDEGIIFDASVYGGVPFFFSINHMGNYFFYKYFAEPLHPSYSSLYLVFAVFLLLQFRKFSYPKYLKTLAVFILTIAIILNTSRIGYVGVLLVLTYQVWQTISLKRIKLNQVIAITLIICTFVILIVSNPRISHSIKNPESVFSLEKNQRLQSWKVSLELINEHPIFGVGIANAKKQLLHKYFVYEYSENFKNESNSHNVFLQTHLDSGLFGFITLIIILVNGIVIGVKYKNHTLIFLILLIFLFGLVESLLSKYHGIVFVSFFYLFLIHNSGTAIKKIDNSYQNQSQKRYPWP